MNSMYLLIFFILLIIGLLSRFSHDNGKRAENQVCNKLKSLNLNEYVVFNDIIIESNEYITQVDHIVLSKKGIFVIETKDYGGTIYGNEEMYKWKQYLQSEEYTFYNPIKQNNTHINLLSRKLKLDRDLFVSIIAFSDRADLNISTNTIVCYIDDVNDIIMQYIDEKISQEDYELISKILIEIQVNTTDEIRNKHKKTVINSINKANENISRNKCPQCSGSLVNRSGKFGAFQGCSNYPKCRYTNNEP